MKFLLPHRFKKIGAIIAPLGFFLWFCMQMGFVTQFLIFLFGKSFNEQREFSYHLVNVIIAILSFFSFLGGIYFVAFSKEKLEDEMVERTRLESFQFSALVQLISIIIGFLSMSVLGEPSESGLMLFFIVLIFLFWLCFICRFNYTLHIKIKNEK